MLAPALFGQALSLLTVCSVHAHDQKPIPFRLIAYSPRPPEVASLVKIERLNRAIQARESSERFCNGAAIEESLRASALSLMTEIGRIGILPTVFAAFIFEIALRILTSLAVQIPAFPDGLGIVPHREGAGV